MATKYFSSNIMVLFLFIYLFLIDMSMFQIHLLRCCKLNLRSWMQCIHNSSWVQCRVNAIRDDNEMGWVRRMGSLLPPCMILFYPSLLYEPRMMGKIFLPHPCPLGPCEALRHPVKLYFLLICPQLLQLFSINLIR